MRVGSLFTGYGGLDMAVGGDLAWYSEIDKAACIVLKAHHSGVQNLGDITQVDWKNVEPVDVLTGGYPCQPFSLAGKRKGTNDERHLWPYVREAIRNLRPERVVLENVRGHLTMGASAVIGELAGLGYDARWGLVRASDAGAPHNRARLFIVANPNGRRYGIWKDSARVGGVETINEGTSQEREWTREEPYPRGTQTTTHTNGGRFQDGLQRTGTGREAPVSPHWMEYARAVKRWETIIGRNAPHPTIYGDTDRVRVNPGFVEWMMGLPLGHVTGHGLTAAQELKMLGNGVCPQQAQLALALLE